MAMRWNGGRDSQKDCESLTATRNSRFLSDSILVRYVKVKAGLELRAVEKVTCVKKFGPHETSLPSVSRSNRNAARKSNFGYTNRLVKD